MFKAHLLKQDWNRDLPRYWNDNSPFKTHFLNALSITLPECEKFFIETIKHFNKALTDEDQIKEVKEFVKQESHHRNAHTHYNDWLEAQGLPVEKLQQDTDSMWNMVRNTLNMKSRLALTICVEHITVVYASVFLGHEELLDQMHPHFRQVWQWHAIEEIEHKSVAMNVWNEIDGSIFLKAFAMMLVLPFYMWYVGKNTIIFLNHDNELWKKQTFVDMIHFLFNKKTGLLRKSFIPWIEFMLPRFHPADQNHSAILANYTKI